MNLRVFGASACLGLLAATCSPTWPSRIQEGGTRAYVAGIDDTPREPGAVRPLAGDVVLENDALRVVIAGPLRPPEHRGAVLEARLRGAPIDDGIDRLSAELRLGDEAVPLTLRTIHLLRRDDRPTVRVVYRAEDARERVFSVERELALGAAGTTLSVHTRVGLAKSTPVADARLVTHVAWGGARAFVPGVGFLDDQEPHEASWVGRRGDAVATVLGQRGAPAVHRARVLAHVDSRFLAATESATAPTELTAAHGFEVEQLLALSGQGLAHAVRQLGWRWGAPHPEVTAHVPRRPPGAEIRVESADGRPWLVTRVGDEEQVVLPLPHLAAEPGASPYRVVATAWGHAPSEVLPALPGHLVRLEIPEGGRVRVRVRDAETNAPLLARVRVLPVAPTPAIALGPAHHAGGAVDTVVTQAGDVTIPLPKGRYRVLVSRGPEWTVAEKVVSVTETYQPRVQVALRHVVTSGAWVGCDFHVHQAPSPDSQVSLEDRVLSLAAEGVAFAVPTDHNHVTRYDDALATLALGGLGTVSGVEVTTADPTLGHFNAFPVPLDGSLPGNGAPSYRETTPQALFDSLHAISPDVVVQVNHPRLNPSIAYFDLFAYDAATGRAREGFSESFDLLEVWNGYDLTRTEAVDAVFAEWMTLLARGLRPVATGNSDSHSIRFSFPGYPRTYVFAEGAGQDPLEVVRAVRAGRSFVTNGPFVEASIAGSGPGAQVAAVDGKVALRVRVQAAPWVDVRTVEVFVGVAPVVTRTLAGRRPVWGDPTQGRRAPPIRRIDQTFDLDVGADTFVVVRVRGEEPMDLFFGKAGIRPLAFTNPIFVDGDGDGVVPWLPRAVPPAAPAPAPEVGYDAARAPSPP